MPQQPASSQSQTTLSALGLNINPNFLDLPNGSLVVANDVIIKRKNVIESRRGLSNWSETIGISTDTVSQLFEYKNAIIANCNDLLYFDTLTKDVTGREIFDVFSGTYSPPGAYRMRFMEANKNLYFTTNQGIKKISAVNASQFSTASNYIQTAGAIQAIDFTTSLQIQQGQTGAFLPIDSTVEYRTTWGYKDVNGNLCIGAPSTQNFIYNYANNAFTMDFNKLLTLLDTMGSTSGQTLLTNTNNYSTLKLTANPTGVQMDTNLTQLATNLDNNLLFANTSVSSSLTISSIATGNPGTITLSSAHGYASGQTFAVTISGVTGTTPTINAIYTATATSTTAFTIPINITASTYTSGGTAIVSVNAPLTINSITMNLAGIVTINTLGTPTNYISDGDYINLQGFVNTVTSQTRAITGVSVGNPTTITLSAAHGYTTGQNFSVTITGTNTSAITTGTYTATATGTNTFTIPVNVATVTGGTGTATFSTGYDLTIFNSQYQVLSVTANTITFLYTYPSGTTPYSITTTSPGTTATISSYNYTNIINTGEGTFPTSLSNTTMSVPLTSGEQQTLTNTLQRLVTRLSLELPDVISASLITKYIGPFTITQSGAVLLNITIPTDSEGNQLNSSYFLQVWRSNVFTGENDNQNNTSVLGSTVIANDELHQVYEYFPNADDYANGYVQFLDDYPDSLAQNNTPLYTNPVTGDGILQSNNIPPYAQDVTFFQNYAFFANTQTQHLISSFQLIGVDNINNGDVITIGNANTSSTYTFVTGVEQVQTFTVGTNSGLNSTYFKLYNTGNTVSYVLWYNVDQTGTQPSLGTNYTYIEIPILSTDSTATIATRSSEIINDLIFDFTASSSSNVFTVTNTVQGSCTAAVNGTVPFFTIAITTTGVGEKLSSGQVLISKTISAAINIDATARSLIRCINHNSASPIYAYYTSGQNTAPGQMLLQAKVLSNTPFYVIASSPVYGNNSGTLGIGTSFTPNISPEHIETGITNAIKPSSESGYITFTTASPHNLQNNYQVIITNTSVNSPSTNVNGVYTVSNVTTNTFDVQNSTVITVNGNHFSWELTSESVSSTNNNTPNRVYYSKLNQPDAVPSLNYFDIGSADQAILRIFALRTTLFVFKTDGLYRITGLTAPFTVQLFDSSCVLIAPDSVDVTDNVVYGWTTKGISSITESGVSQISTPVDTQILALATYPNFQTATWGVGYNSDYSYTVFTNASNTDSVATIGYRYSTLTNTWTNIVRTQTSGYVRPSDDTLYMGSGTENVINKERKNFNRTDYADKDFNLQISTPFINSAGNILQFNSVADIDIGDVIYQNQYLSIYTFNELLENLDANLSLSQKNYSSLAISTGADLRNAIVALAAKLDADTGLNIKTYSAHIANYTHSIVSNSINNPTVINTGSITNLVDNRLVIISGTQSPQSIPLITGQYQVSLTGTWGTSSVFSIPVAATTAGGSGLTYLTSVTDFLDIQACYNAIINLLNTDSGSIVHNYQTIQYNDPIEAVVIEIDNVTNKVTLNIGLPWVTGPVTVFKSIPCQVIYAPLTFGDVLKTKQIYEATAMFSNTAFTNATLSFSSDLKPDYISIPFNNLGNGIFGSYSSPGFGGGYFGGAGNSVPKRTYIPLQAQRCRFLNVQFQHQIAREAIALYGVTLTGNTNLSTRGYR
jgi:hypothetical protein